MNNQVIINNIVHGITLGFMFILVIAIVVLALSYYFTDGNRNIKKKQTYLKLLIIFAIVLYIVRFGTIFTLSLIYKASDANITTELFKNILRFIQLMVIAILPTYSLIQSYIFEYQTIIKDNDVSSKGKAINWKRRGLISTIALVFVLQVVINLF